MSLKLLASAALSLVLCACHSKDRIHVETDEGPPREAANLQMADPKVAHQLLAGFYGPEGSGWRWTAGKFSVSLGTPAFAFRDGAVLTVQLSIPKPLIDRVKTTTLTAEIDHTILSPESFTQTGTFVFTREIPAKLLLDDTVRVDFSLDRFLPPGTADGRELGIIVTSVGLETRKSAPSPN